VGLVSPDTTPLVSSKEQRPSPHRALPERRRKPSLCCPAHCPWESSNWKQTLSGWRAGPSADAVRLRQMAWVAETAKMLPPHAPYQQCVTLYVCSNAKFWPSPSQPSCGACAHATATPTTTGAGKGHDREGSAGRVRKRASKLLQRPDLPADLHPHLDQGKLCQALRPHAHGGRSAQDVCSSSHSD
jgi:hypothetical protein